MVCNPQAFVAAAAGGDSEAEARNSKSADLADLPCILHMDSLRCHNKRDIKKHLFEYCPLTTRDTAFI